MKLVRENTNTKREIKEMASKLRSLTSQLMTTEAQNVFQKMGTKGNITARGSTENVSSKEELDRKKESRDLGCQANIEQIKKKKEESISEELLSPVNSYEEFAKIQNKIWPEKFYKSSFIAEGSPLRANLDADLVVLEELETETEELDVNKGIKRAYEDRFPELKELEGKAG